MKKHGLMIATAFGIILTTNIISAITAEFGSARDLKDIRVWMQVLNGVACGIGLYGGLLLSKEKAPSVALSIKKKLTKNHKIALIIGAITLIVNNFIVLRLYTQPYIRFYKIPGFMDFARFYNNDWSQIVSPILLTALCLLALGFIFYNRIKTAKITYIIALTLSLVQLFRPFAFYPQSEAFQYLRATSIMDYAKKVALHLLSIPFDMPFIIVLSSITIVTSLVYTKRIISNDNNSTSSSKVLFNAVIILVFIISCFFGSLFLNSGWEGIYEMFKQF